jgi:hypothetical protein
MSLRSPEQKAARMAALKAKLAPKPKPTLAYTAPSANSPVNQPGQQIQQVQPALTGRMSNGTFAPKHLLRSNGRPRDALCELCRRYQDQYKLMQKAAQMGARIGEYRKIDHATQLRAIQFVIERGFGPPPETVEMQRSEDGSTIVKRVIGVADDSI